MAQTIKVKRSAVAGKVPTTSDLQLGELALNTYDGKLYTKKDNGTASIVEVTPNGLTDANIASGAEIAVSKLADGAARQLLQTDAAGTGVEWTSNVDIPGTLDVTGAATFDSTATAPAGSAGAPSIQVGTGTSVKPGLYSPGADQLAISTGGTGRLFVDASGNVGIGTVPSYLLHLNSSGAAQARVVTSSSTSVAQWYAENTTGASISIAATGSGYTPFGVININNGYIYSGSDLALASTSEIKIGSGPSALERLRITSDGKVGIGTSAPAQVLHCVTANGTASQVQFTQQFQREYRVGIPAGGTNFEIYDVSASSSRLNIDSSGRVGIGTSAPASSNTGPSLDVLGPVLARGAIANHQTDAAVFEYNSNRAIIRSYGNSAGTGMISFNTGGGGSSADAERIRIDPVGRLLIGTTSNESNALAIVQGYAGVASGQGVLALRLGTARPAAADTGIGSIRFESTSNTASNYHYASISAFSDGASSADTDIPGRLVFSTTADGTSSPTEAMRINNQRELLIGTTTRTANGGVLQISNGITFPGTQSACSDPNTLDDYEEGTFTATLQFGGASTGSTQTSNAYYTKIGNVLYYNLSLTLSVKGSATGNATIAGLPFTAKSAAGLFPNGVIRAVSTVTHAASPYAAVSQNTTTILLLDNNAGTQRNLTDTAFSNGSEFAITGFYYV